ncbi:MAG TPA: DivIVA domain-containing protein, partial [Pseudolysinimonas sp.]|nr:DivIVA domain-containing protein [Pseudolysinimonas sp.]
AYQAERNDITIVSAESIRDQAFTMRKGGYQAAHVDAALERLEDAFAIRERDRAVEQTGDAAWFAAARARATEILDRLIRPRGRRFRHVNIFTLGYSVREVDAFTDRITAHFQSGAALTVDELRTVAFRAQRGGYQETQVDVLLADTTSVLLAIR